MALAEMSFAGQLGVHVDIGALLEQSQLSPAELLFSESNSRFLIEVPSDAGEAFEGALGDDCKAIGRVTESETVMITNGDEVLVNSSWQSLFDAWHSPLDWS